MADLTIIEEIAENVMKNSNDWVLILGTGVSHADNMKAADEEFTDQIARLNDENGDLGSVKEKVCQAVQESNYSTVKEVLYGNIWNGSSFRNSEDEVQRKRREDYAGKFAVRKNINMERDQKKDIRSLLGHFSGLILTTCQDETIEAILENERCSTVENGIYTPYSLTTLSSWKKLLESNSLTLIKLYGTCTDPSKLLLSGKDMDMYYSWKDDKLPTMEALDWIFQNKNLLFVGMDLIGQSTRLNRKPALAPGIVGLLKRSLPKAKGNNLHRYAILQIKKEEGSENDSRRKFKDLKDEQGIEVIGYYKVDGTDQVIYDYTEKQKTSKDSAEEKSAEGEAAKENNVNKNNAGEKSPQNKALTKDEAEKVFWEYYNRRPRHHISDREIHILEEHILKADIPDDQEKKEGAVYNRNEVIRIALAANRFAEFCDFWDITKMYDEKIKWEQKIRYILNQHIDDRSRELHQIFQFYGSGFPIGFLNLMGKDEKDLDDWKKAVIRLHNSGAYVISCNRKGIYEKIGYADTLVQKAGIHINQGEGCRKSDSYVYPAVEEIDVIDIKEGIDTKEKFREMFDRMVDILRDKCDGYNFLHPLLETEFQIILDKVKELENYEKEPELLYYLFRECRIQPKEPEKFIKRIEMLQNEIGAKENDEKKALCKKLMLYQVRMLVSSRRSGCETEELLNLYEDAIKEITEYAEKQGKDPSDESIFIQQVQLHLLKGRIYGSSAAMDVDNFSKNLEHMKSMLEKAEEDMKKRKENTGTDYLYLKAEADCLYGDYYIIRYRMAKKTQGVEAADYQSAIPKYNDALKFYRKYPMQYKMQEADVQLRMAETHYCRQKDDQIWKDGDKCLERAYQIYRNYNNLHGIADALRTLVISKPDKSSSLYHAAETIYRELGDELSCERIKPIREAPSDERKFCCKN